MINKTKRRQRKIKNRKDRVKKRLAADRLAVRKTRKQEKEINKTLDIVGEPETVQIEETNVEEIELESQ